MRQVSDSSAAQKVCRILKALSSPSPQRLTDIAVGSGVNKATALRLLEEMMAEGFVLRDPQSKRYVLGDEAITLGLAMQGRDHIRDRARPAILKLADLCGDTVLLSTRSGRDAVCIDREFGSFPIRANYLDLGMRRPLGVGAGSLALLAWLPDDEVQAVLELNQSVIEKKYPLLSIDMIKQEVTRSRERGYAMLLDVVVRQMGGIGVPIFGRDGRPFASLSVAALTDRIVGRREMLVSELKKVANELSNPTQSMQANEVIEIQ
ncbi:IclR family transcriptional regulator [Orrella sp. NBD-18]|uniref:IclR family transcriptional regulator n=1 Tax=Sheuella amnicola TaxID=2707330 RepID=A0A6B2QWJ5_9BURK|nr:IclR family transcriptional regulator [Sheuella amnicola]NDY83016.1 IclR family transcriptional regulator [Sheuella amnicola]HBI83203.1 IclR family transcriptional regulator [Alcaligenaceae bacterium]